MIRKALLILSIILSIMLLVPVGANALEFTPVPATATTEVGQTATFGLNIENDANHEDAFVISVSGDNLEWVNLERYYVKLDPLQTEVVDLIIFPDENGSYVYDVEVFSKNNPDIRASDKVFLSVIVPRNIDIKNFWSSVEGENLKLSVDAFALKETTLYIDFKVMDSEGNRVKYITKSSAVKGNEKVEEEIYIGDLKSGKYKVEASIPEINLYKEDYFEVQPLHNVIKTRKTTSNPFVEEVEILVENQGNIEENYLLREVVPSSQWVTFEDRPDNEISEGPQVTYQWMLKGLATGEPVYIKYRIEYWPAYVLWFVVGICVLGLVGLSLIKVSKPRIKKHYFKKKGEKLIVLEVKGSLSRDVRNTMVKDTISPLARVDENFDGPKPVIRASESGTELIWRIGDLKARGDVLLSYKLKPLIGAELKMPKAHLTFRDDSDRRFRVSSDQIIVK